MLCKAYSIVILLIIFYIHNSNSIKPYTNLRSALIMNSRIYAEESDDGDFESLSDRDVIDPPDIPDDE